MTADDLRIVLLAGPFQSRGTSGYTLRLARGLRAAGVGVQIVTPDAELLDESQRGDLPILEYPRLTSSLMGIVNRRWLASDLARHPPDLIHAQSRTMLPWGMWLAQRLERPLVLTAHDYVRPSDPVPTNWKRLRRIIAVSESVRRDVVARFQPPPGTVVCVPSGVEIPPEIPEPLPLEPGHVPVVGTAGPLEAVKGFPFFLGAARRILDTGRDVEFVVVGAGPEEANLRRLASRLEIAGHVTFAPYVVDPARLISAVDIFCLPSLQQGLGTIMLEALASARPVIASRVGGIYGVIEHGRTGLLVPPANSEALAERALELLCDPAKARTIGLAGRAVAMRDYAAGAMVASTIQVYKDVLADAGSAGLASAVSTAAAEAPH